ncbi:MAG: iron-containing redox enzyme family protein [Thermoleophilaceae bacterium]
MSTLNAEARTVELPPARGALSEWLLAVLAGPPRAALATPPEVPAAEARRGEDFHLSLYVLYELHYGGFEGVDAGWEWEPSLLAVRRELERAFEAALEEDVGDAGSHPPEDVEAALRAVGADGEGGVSLPGHVARSGTLQEVREMVVHRSAYQLKEADPHSWTIPRLRGAPKAALVEVQFDEYGAGDPARLHQTLYGETMDTLGLDPRPGAHLDLIPGVTLATANLASLLGLHRRLRGASVGHLALFEMTSPDANRRYGHGLRRLGLGPRATGFYDEHVEADALHDALAVHDVAGALARSEPELAGQIVFGARALAAVEGRFSEHVLGCWARAENSLRAALPQPGSTASGTTSSSPTSRAGPAGAR